MKIGLNDFWFTGDYINPPLTEEALSQSGPGFTYCNSFDEFIDGLVSEDGYI